MQTFEKAVKKRSLTAIAIFIGIAFPLGLYLINQNNCDLVGNLERHDCDLSKLKE